MSAIAVLIQKETGSLFMDGGFYDQHGRLITIGTKFVTLECSGCIISFRGLIPLSIPDSLIAAVDLPDVLSAMPSAVRNMQEASLKMGGFCKDLEVVCLGWSAKDDAPQVWLTATYDREACSLLEVFPSYSAFKPVQSPVAWIAPAVDIERISARLGPVKSADDLNPDIFGMEVFDVLRSERHIAPGGVDLHGVAGFVEVAQVRKGSVEVRVLKHWPDKPGFLVTPKTVELASSEDVPFSMEQVMQYWARGENKQLMQRPVNPQ